jgi:hypothetical protein
MLDIYTEEIEVTPIGPIMTLNSTNIIAFPADSSPDEPSEPQIRAGIAAGQSTYAE